MGHARAAWVSCLALLLAAPAALADVLVVAPTGAPFAEIQDAVLAAQSGDIVLVKSGSYGRIHTFNEKSVSIIADAGATVTVTDSIHISAGASTTVVLRGLTVAAPTNSDDAGLTVSGAGPVRIEHCSFTGQAAPSSYYTPWASAGASLWSANVAFAHCSIVGGTGSSGVFQAIPDAVGGDGLDAYFSNVSLWQCSVTGGTGGSGMSNPATMGGRGLTIYDSTVVLDGCTVSGGTGGTGAFGIVGQQGAQGGDSGFMSSGLVRHTDTTLAGGAGGAGGPGYLEPGPPGPPGGGFVVEHGSVLPHADTARDFIVNSPVRSGQVANFEFGTVSCDAVFLLYSVTTQQPWLAGPQGTLVPGPQLGIAALALPCATGTQLFAVTIPALPPGIEGVNVFLQSLHDNSTDGLQLGPFSVLTLLDGAIP